MNIYRTVTASAAALFLAAALWGCSVPANRANTDRIYEIGVIQIVSHESLDATYEGFLAALAELGFADGENVKLDFQNAQNDPTILDEICDRFVAQSKDLILAISTPAAQAIAAKTSDLPIVGAAVTNYANAGLVASDDAPGGNVTGTSDMNPTESQIDLLLEFEPEAETVGFLYNANESNSRFQIDIAKRALEERGLKWVEATATNDAEVQEAIRTLIFDCDALYIPADNTLAACMDTVRIWTCAAKIKTVCGAENMTLKGGLGTISTDYYHLGYETGRMAADILNGANPADMPIVYCDMDESLIINGRIADEIGYVVPKKYINSVAYTQ